MIKILYFNNDEEKCVRNPNHKYYALIDYAFSEADFFMLVYVNYYGNGYTPKQKYFKEKLESYEVKSRTNPSWPGTSKTYCPNSTYTIVFYKTTEEAKAILKEADAINTWSRPDMPEDLAFFKGNKCWFFSVGHEDIAAVINPTQYDLDFLETQEMASRKNITFCEDNSFGLGEENLI